MVNPNVLAFSLSGFLAFVLALTADAQSPTLLGRRRALTATSCTNLNDASLQAYWKLDEASGNAIDSKGANTLTDNNGVTSAQGKIINCRGFSSAATRYLSLTDNPSLSTGDISFTGGLWVFLGGALGAGDFPGLMGKWDTGQKEYILYLNGDAQKYEWQVSNDGTAVTTCQASSAAAPEYAAWHYVLFWHDASANTLNIQVDNGTVDTVSYSSGVFDGTSTFTLGSLSTSSQLNGFIDEAFFTKRVLTAEERTRLYNSDYGCSPL